MSKHERLQAWLDQGSGTMSLGICRGGQFFLTNKTPDLFTLIRLVVPFQSVRQLILFVLIQFWKQRSRSEVLEVRNSI